MVCSLIHVNGGVIARSGLRSQCKLYEFQRGQFHDVGRDFSNANLFKKLLSLARKHIKTLTAQIMHRIKKIKTKAILKQPTLTWPCSILQHSRTIEIKFSD